MSNNNSAFKSNLLNATISAIKQYGVPDALTGVSKWNEWLACKRTTPEVLRKQWGDTLRSCNVYTTVDVETKIVDDVAKAIINEFKLVRRPGEDRDGVVHAPACTILWMVDRRSDATTKPGILESLVEGQYGYLRQAIIGAVKQLEKVYGKELRTTDGSERLIDVIEAGLITGEAYRNLKQTRFTSTGWIAEGPDARMFWARAKAAAQRVIGLIDEMVPQGKICECGRVHGLVDSDVTVPATTAADEAAADENPQMDEVRELTNEAVTELMNRAEMTVHNAGYVGRSATMKLIGIFNAHSKADIVESAKRAVMAGDTKAIEDALAALDGQNF